MTRIPRISATQPEPTVADLQDQLTAVRKRLNDVEAIAFRPIRITVKFPGWPNPRKWLADWRSGRDQRVIERRRRKTLRAWRRLCARAHRDPRSITSAELDRAWAAYTGKDGWRAPTPLFERIRKWWAARELRRGIRRMQRIMAAAAPADVALANEVSRRKIQQRIRQARGSDHWPFHWLRIEPAALENGLIANEWAANHRRTRP